MPRAFGGGSLATAHSLACWDATKPMHLPLPRAVGPYTTVRVTKRFSSTARDLVFGTYRGSNDHWTNVCCLEDALGTDPINGTNNVVYHTLPLAGLSSGSSGLTATPSAFTVQVMNPEPLNVTGGIVYGGIMNTQAKIVDRTETWDSYMGNFIAYQAPRMMSAGKLALRGVKASSYPLSMSQLSEFTPLGVFSDTTTTLSTANAGHVEPHGFAPILVNNPQSIDLEYLVTVEFRVRFDLLNPASAGHTHHPVSSDSTWDAMIRKAVALGHGFIDIVDTVANAGSAASKVAALM